MKFPALKTSVVLLALALAACASNESISDKPVQAAASNDIGRQALPAGDGWASVGPGTDGGAKATAANVFTVSTRAELVKALATAGNAAKIIYIKGTVNLSTDDNNKELFEKDYADPAYNFDAYVKAYAPAVWNTKLEKGRPVRDLTGPLEEARKNSVERQRKQITIKLNSNTSIIGLGKDAKIIKGNLWIGPEAENIIIRNITFEDSFDYFPGWDPGDSWKVDKSYPGCQEAYVDANTGPQKCPGGRWNSEYDLISINGGKRVWIDHNTFTDGQRPDKLFPPNFPFPQNEITQKIQHHDGLIDVTNGGDLVTISHNIFKDHDKTSLIGGSDSSKIDTGKLNVTYHDNIFDNSGQRLPRVRFGKVHSYNNYFSGDAAGADDPKLSVYENHLKAIKEHGGNNVFRGAFGIGKESAIYSENNYFEVKNADASAVGVIQGGTVFFDQGSYFNGKPVDAVKAINAVDPKKQVSPNVGWKPTLYARKPIPATEVPAYVKANAGAGKL
ncbi:PbsX family transcriptional regulator [Uliginosibacterium sediminicola]|uniref:PbsX family transcriptional regulator n=1 Tax=Uliginosibacterium sediminicola TaxID=2024550 RepID=A0ABU9YWF0_9RHOO